MKSLKIVGTNLNHASVAIQNAKGDAEILALVSPSGYDANKLKEGLALHGVAQDKLNNLQSALGDQLGASRDYKSARTAARKSYQALAKSCRALWHDQRAKLAKIGLNKTMPNSDGPFLAQARTLFNTDNYDKDMLTELADHGYDAAKFKTESAKIDAMDDANSAHESTKGAKQQATREMRTSVKDLERWTARFKKFARMALDEKPQLLEKLGVPSRTTRTPAQRAAPAKAAATRRANKQIPLPQAA